MSDFDAFNLQSFLSGFPEFSAFRIYQNKRIQKRYLPLDSFIRDQNKSFTVAAKFLLILIY